MSRNKTNLALFSLLLSFLIGAVNAAENNSESKLREALRSAMLQLRSAQNERTALQTSQAENEEKIKALTAQVATLSKQASVTKKTSADQQAQLVKFKEAVQNWQTAYNQAVELANAKEGARAKLANDVIILRRRVADQQSKNAALFRTANEILTRYERFGLGDALAAKEPFVGITRVKLENLVQNYQDKLLEEKIRESDSTAVEKITPTNQARGAQAASNEPSSQNSKRKP